MDVLKKIEYLRRERSWSEYQLAEKSGLTQSTISSWYRNNVLPTLPSLIKICDAFQISLSAFFLEDDEMTLTLTADQRKLVENAARLTPEQYKALLSFLETL